MLRVFQDKLVTQKKMTLMGDADGVVEPPEGTKQAFELEAFSKYVHLSDPEREEAEGAPGRRLSSGVKPVIYSIDPSDLITGIKKWDGAVAVGTEVTESARACSYYSISTGLQTGAPPGCTILTHPRVKKCPNYTLSVDSSVKKYLIRSIECQKVSS